MRPLFHKGRAQRLSPLSLLTLPLLSVTLLSITLLSATAFARPQVITQEKVDGELTVRITLEEQYILGDVRTPCTISVSATGEDKPFTAGDTITIKVFEDDVPGIQLGDDLIWSLEEDPITEEELSAQALERTYDCSFAEIQDFIGGLEVYGYAKTDKAECGFLCSNDAASTNNITMDQMDDDMAEDDDTLADAYTPPRRGVSNRIAKDPDWFKLTYTTPIELRVRALSRFQGGMLTLALFDNEGALLHEGALEADESALRLEPPALVPGEYFVQVGLEDEADFNFYDLEITESELQTDCAPGGTEERPCGLCGQEVRTCDAMGAWGAWGACEGVGVCEPGAEELRACGETGSQSRSCQNDCSWGEFSDCIQCDEGAEEACYSGPEGTRGVGQCTVGLRVCSRGSWSACQGDVWPTREVCNDNIDNDCDGAIDLNDSECVGAIGAACGAESPCGEGLECLAAPFPEGYCGKATCEGCEGVCANALGSTYCLAPCETLFECRSGYLCSPVGINGELACTPPCLMESDCGPGQQCVENICVGEVTGSPNNPAGGTGEILSPSQDEGCEQSPRRGVPLSLLTLLALLGALRLRRFA